MRKKLDIDYFISASELLDNKYIPRWDYHIHTKYTDGKATVEEVFKKGIEAGLEVLIFTEHAEPWRNNDPGWFMRYVEEIKKFRIIYQPEITVFIGIEANTISFDGDIELTAEMRTRCEFILGAAHRYPGLNSRKITELSNSEAIELEFRTLMGLSTNKEIDAIAHIGATCSKYHSPFPLSLTREVIRTAAKNGVAIEVNPAYHSPLLGFLELCAEENAILTFGSNAHGFSDIGSVVRELQGAFDRA